MPATLLGRCLFRDTQRFRMLLYVRVSQLPQCHSAVRAATLGRELESFMSVHEHRHAIDEPLPFLLGYPRHGRIQPKAGTSEPFLYHLEPENLLQPPVLIHISSERPKALLREVGPQTGAEAGKPHLGPPYCRRQLASQPMLLSIQLFPYRPPL